MNTQAIFDFIKALLPYLPMALNGLTVAKDIILWGFDAVGNMVDEDRDPTDEEWNELNARIDSIREKLHSDDV